MKYNTGYRALMKFADAIGWVPTLPVSEAALILFVASKVGQVKASTMKGYLCSVHSWHVDEGVQVDYTPFLRLKRALKGMAKSEAGTPIKQAVPVTMAAVARMGAVTDFSNVDEVVFMAIASLATAGLFRLGELVPYKVSSPPVLLRGRVDLNQAGVMVHLPRSKTDPLGLTGPMMVSRSDGLACPRLWIAKMKRLQGYHGEGPMFVSATGRPVTREWVIHRLNRMMSRAGLGGQRYSGHSFRRGGATSLAAAGVPDHLIAQLGRWKSTAYQLYVVATAERLAKAQREMAAALCLFGVIGQASRPPGARKA